MLIRILYTKLGLKSTIVLDCVGRVRDCIYIFGVVWRWIRDGFRAKPGEDYVMKGLGR